jgi:hypothetical protein
LEITRCGYLLKVPLCTCFILIRKSDHLSFEPELCERLQVNSRLQTQLERLGKTLASRSGQPVCLFALPQTEQHQPSLPTLKAPERLAEPSKRLYAEKIATLPLQEAVESFSARQVARVTADLNPLALRIYALLNLLGCTVAHRRGYHRKAGQGVYFCPAESICATWASREDRSTAHSKSC